MKASHWRCFWRWPPGHRWERIVESTHACNRCRHCGKTEPLSFKPDPQPPHLYGDGGGD